MVLHIGHGCLNNQNERKVMPELEHINRLGDRCRHLP
jgi:hypothetical protein